MTTFYVYITDQCKSDAARHGVINDIQKLADKLEDDQSARGLQRYYPSYRKKEMGTHGRLAIEEYDSDDDTIVLCFVRYFIKSSSEYNAFCQDIKSYYDRNKVAESEIESFLVERKEKPVKIKPPLTLVETDYLQSASAHHYIDEGAFLESYDWVERISKSWAKNYLSRYWDLIEKIDDGKLAKGVDIISHDKNTNVKILFRSFPEHNRVFLVAPIDPRKEGDEQEMREKYSDRNKYSDLLTASSVDKKELISKSRRAYPTIITYQEDIWIQVENSIEANLALSPEEESILESVMAPTSQEKKYPLFINGRPGSGKSTILQYLFADYLARFIELSKPSEPISPPLYLTYSTPLLQQARSAVENILTCGAKNVENGTVQIQTFLTKDSEIFHSCFRNFRDFLRSLLPPEIRESFVQANYVDFDRFKKLWDEKCRKHPIQDVRSIGAELGWHTIRTYIKGMQHESGSVIDPEYYQVELARNTKSISDKTFATIYEYVWENWYEPLCKNGYWDDQDLARQVLTHANKKLSCYSAVFCDESQDFTTIELELIEQLSIYSEREIPSYLVKYVPFAFAGDPFQTLNPTGFNWSAMQSSFHDNIVTQLDPVGAAKLEFNFKELAFNYRSAERIVKLSNLVQLLRAVLLRIKGLSPQHSWTRQSTVSPVWFRRDDASCQATLREQTELVIIIPCQENGELEYIKADPFLKSMAIQDGEISRNILSPARAKGLEYDRVLLYGFGDEAANRLPNLLEHIKDPGKEPPDIEQRLAWEYFLNQFYVAISRPRKRLFIVDSDVLSPSSFWSFTHITTQKLLPDLYEHSDEWREEIGGIIQGDDSSWSDDRDDPLELAHQWRDQGRIQRDPHLMRLAKDNFKRADRDEDASLCEAEQYEYEGEFGRAAKLFTQLRVPKSACRCYWAHKDTDSIIRLVTEFSEVATYPHYIAASAINRNHNTAPQINIVLETLERVTPPSFPDMPGEIDAWRWFFSRFTDRTGEAIVASDREKSEWRPYVERLIKIVARFELPLGIYPEIAKLLYLSEDPKAALDHWNKHCRDHKPDPNQDKWLTRAHAETEAYPANIRFYNKLGDDRAVIDQWEAANRLVDDKTPINFLLDSAIKLCELSAIRSLLPTSGDLKKVIEALGIIDQSNIYSLKGALPVAIAHALVVSAEWRQLIKFASDQTIQNKELNSKIKVLGIKWDSSTLIASAVRASARSNLLVNSKSQLEVSDFLRRNLIIEKDASRDKQDSVKSILKLIDIAESGAAFERAFRLTYALEFYEQFFEKNHRAHHVLNPSHDQSEFAKRRWLLCKHRLADLPSTSKDATNENKHRKEANNRESEWKISTDQEPDYPTLKPMSELELPDSEQVSKISINTPDSKKEDRIVASPSSIKSPDEIARNLIQNSVDIHIIVSSTGLSIEEVQQLQQQLNGSAQS